MTGAWASSVSWGHQSPDPIPIRLAEAICDLQVSTAQRPRPSHDLLHLLA